MTIILDSSAAVEISLNRKQASFFSDILLKADWVIVPDLFVSEVSNVFWKYNQFENLPLEICESTLDSTISLIDDFIDSKSLYKEAFSFACLTQHSVYDMMYLVVTRRENGILLSVDQKLIRLANKYSIKTI